MIKIMKALLLFFIFIVSFSYAQIVNGISVLSVSTDGKYAISGNDNNNVYLWNLEDKTHKQVNKGKVNSFQGHANKYSVGFIEGTNIYFYQDSISNEVFIVDAEADKEIKRFNPKFQAYGAAINKDMTRYAASEDKGIIHVINMENPEKYREVGRASVSFSGTGKLFQPHFTPDQKYIVATNGGGELWILDAQTGKLLQDIIKNVGQTSNAISPNGDYVITVDSGHLGVKYNFNGRQIKRFFLTIPNNKEVNTDSIRGGTTSINFIDDENVIVTWHSIKNGFEYVSLSNPDEIKASEDYGVKHYLAPIKYLPLIEKPNAEYPSMDGLYPQTQSYMPVVATSPEKHILVMAQANGSGIMVYKFDPDDQILKLIWSPEL